MPRKKKVEPVITGTADVAPEILAKAIIEVSESAKKFLSSRLTKKAILVLLKDMTGIPQGTIETVLDGAAQQKREAR